MMRKAATALCLLWVYRQNSVLAFQNRPGRPRSAFEVASVKPCSTQVRSTYGGRAGLRTLQVNCLPLDLIIRDAYLTYADGVMNRRSQNTRIEGGPGWIGSERYNIDARAATETPPGIMEGEMMRSLLEDRFRLKVRHETRMLPVFKVTVSSRGLQVSKAKESCFSPGMVEPPLTAPRCGVPKFRPGGMDLSGATMADFCSVISSIPRHALDKPALDATGLAGNFDFHLEWSSDPAGVAGPDGKPIPVDREGEMRASLNKLGLRLESAKGPVDVLVIDHVERPSAN